MEPTLMGCLRYDQCRMALEHLFEFSAIWLQLKELNVQIWSDWSIIDKLGDRRALDYVVSSRLVELICTELIGTKRK